MFWFFPFFWLLFIACFFFASRFFWGWGWRGRSHWRYDDPDAEEILKRRLARGEIDEAEYQRLRTVLTRQGGQA